MNKFIYLNTILLIVFAPFISWSHGGEDHAHADEAVTSNRINYFSTEAVSDKYELLLKYEPIKANSNAHLILYISEYETNKPVNNADIKITSPQNAEINFTISQISDGKYNINTEFPENQNYSLTISVNSPHGADLLLLQNIEIGKELPGEPDHAHSFLGDWKMWLLIILALLIGLGVGMLLQKRNLQKGREIASVFLIIIYCSIPATQSIAHGDEDHVATTASTTFTNTFYVPKETQFLFDVLTQKAKKIRFTESLKIPGTVIPGSAGHAVVSVPQNGRIISLNVDVGQQVKAGQQLAVIQQVLDAGTEVGLLSERNNLMAEYEAAKKEYERLSSIKDIAAKRDVDEAEARLQRAENNLKLYSGNTGRTITLIAPIGGQVSNFNLSIGSTVNAGQTLFTITDLSMVYVEARVFMEDMDKIRQAERFTIENKTDTADLKLISLGQEINATNQSQRVLFELNNTAHNFRIGEFVNVFAFAKESSMQLALPNSAITEINGRPVIFIKNAAEVYSAGFADTGTNIRSHTAILKGVEEGQRIVNNAAYQLQMIYLNQ
jgi:membrane fusion protein, heavy metal efflux system